MSGERFDYTSERQCHEKFVGREVLLARLDELLVEDGPDRWVVVTGGPGMGKSAILSAWLARREAAGAVVLHHFIRRGAYDWDDPAQMVASLVAQIDERFPGAQEPDPGARVHPAARLAKALSRVSERELGPRDGRMVVLIDGLDEYDPPVGALPGDPLAAFLPHVLPRWVSFLCASRPRHPYVSSLAARDGDFVQLDLDASDSAADNEATVRRFWEDAAGPLGLEAQFVEEAVVRAGGNVQHAVQLRRQIGTAPALLRRVEDIPRGLESLIEQTWERIAHDPVVVEGLGILCAAREALTLDGLRVVAGWIGDATRRAFLRGAKEVLIETQRPDRQREYRLHHDSIRAHIAQVIGDAALRGHHRALAQRLATWPAPAQAATRRYALRHALIHRAEAGDWTDAWRIAGDMSLLEAKCRELGAHEVEADIARIAERCRTGGDAAIGDRFNDLARALVRESHWLRTTPEATAAVLWNRLRRFGWSEHDLSMQLRAPTDAAFLRVRHTATCESPALIRDLVGHASWVTACAVTPDSRCVVSASLDQTLKVWDLESGRALATLQGHADGVTACAVTPDGRRVVSASHDQTLKVWAAARLVTVPAGESPAGGGCPATIVVIPGGGKGDQPAGSPEVNVSGSDREASNLAGCSGSETGSPENEPPRVRIVGMIENAEPLPYGRRPLLSVVRWAYSTERFPGVLEDDMPRRNSERKPGTTRGSPRRSRTAKAARINRHAVKSRCACEWDGWGRISEDGSGQNNPNPSEDPWGKATMVACTAVCDRIQPPDSDQTELGITKHTKGEDKLSGAMSMPGAGLIRTPSREGLV